MAPTPRLRGIPLVIGAIVLLSACAPETLGSPAVTVTDVPRESRVVVPSPPEDPAPTIVWPLTGLDAEGVSAADLEGVAIAVKIDNHPHARPPKNLEAADIVFEEYVEFGISRLVAVFHSVYPEEVGPIRSMRPMDPNIVGSLYAPLVFSGASRDVLRAVQKTDQVLIYDDNQDDGFFRVRVRPAPHNLHGTMSEFVAQALEADLPPATRQFDYAYPVETATAATEGSAIDTIDIKFSPDAHPHWDWDESKRLWMRFEKDKPHVSLDDIQISATNVVILRVKVRYVYGYLPESLMIVDDAPGYVATDGRITEIRWSKSSRRDAIHLTTLDGGPVYLAPGQTWVELVPISGAKHTAVIKFDDVAQD
ncbi:MAG: DUF3048 domain-containing protein [Demequinaceae bacterium]|nr:DUF3048 domain-containing protein [Demequinaceae bacterium]